MQTSSLVEQIKSRGYTIPNIIVPSQELLSIKELIDQNNKSIIIPAPKSIHYVLQRSRQFIDSHFQLKDVPYYHKISLGPIKIEKYGTIHPYGLPVIRLKGEDSFYGCLQELLLTKLDKTKEDYYRGIELSKKNTDLSSLSYTHELIHTQLNHVPGLVKDYSNIEILSIFLETVEAYETSDKLLRIHDIERLDELSGIIKELQSYHSTSREDIKEILVEGSSYAESTLKAYNLFIIYYNSSLKLKKEILSNIQKILNYEISVEDFLSMYDITFESSQDVKRLTNYLKR